VVCKNASSVHVLDLCSYWKDRCHYWSYTLCCFFGPSVYDPTARTFGMIIIYGLHSCGHFLFMGFVPSFMYIVYLIQYLYWKTNSIFREVTGSNKSAFIKHEDKKKCFWQSLFRK
jgi:hypothetical protein